MRKLIHPLDKYVFGEFWRVFFVTALGFPLLVEVLDLAENIDKYVAQKLPNADIALSYFYWMPESMFLVLPAAVLFATVFTIGSLTRHSEITAAKASGISFYRVIVPIFVGAAMATLAGLAIGELVPAGNQQRGKLLQMQRFSLRNDRVNFSFLAQDARTFQINYLRVEPPSLKLITIERLSKSPDVPDYVTHAEEGYYKRDKGVWMLKKGVTFVMIDSLSSPTFSFDSLLDKQMKQRPIELVASSKTPDDMGFRELGEYIKVMEYAGADMNLVRVERMLKIAIPVTCIIIALFGAPLATSNQRGGASYGIGVSLASTVLFLLLINLTRAFGGKGVMEPEVAAWLPSMVFGLFGLLMLSRVRT